MGVTVFIASIGFVFLMGFCSVLGYRMKSHGKGTAENSISKLVCASVISFGLLGNELTIGISHAENPPATEKLYGLKKDRLLPCKTKSNCISSSSISSLEHYGRPWSFSATDGDGEFKKITSALKAVTEFPLKVVEVDESKRYVRVETKSAIPITGIDDIEFLVNSLDNIITYRSNSREVIMAGPENVGDGGSNKNRLEVIRRKLGVTEMGMNDEAEDFMKANEKLSIFDRMNMASQPNEINFLDNKVPSKSVDVVE